MIFDRVNNNIMDLIFELVFNIDKFGGYIIII